MYRLYSMMPLMALQQLRCVKSLMKLSRKPLLPAPLYPKQVLQLMLAPVLFALTKKMSQTHLFLQVFISLVALTSHST